MEQKREPATKNRMQLRREILHSYLRSFKRPLRIIRSDPLALTGTIILLLLTFVAIFAPFLATHDPHEMLERREGVIFAYQDEEWLLDHILSEESLNDIQFIDGQPYVIGNQGQFARHDGQGWQQEELFTTSDLIAMSFLTPDHGLVVGEAGEIWSYHDGQWTLHETPVTTNLLAVELIEDDFALAVGEEATILRWDGISWEELDSPVREDLYSLSFLHRDLGFISGGRGTILRWEDGSLSQEMLMSFRNFYGISLYSPEHGLAVGERGTIFRFDGQRWSEEHGPHSRELRDIYYLSPEEIIVVGRFGIVSEYDGQSWERMDIAYRRHWRGIAGDGEELMVVGSDPYINELSPPTRENFFGTTHLGRDIFSQTIYGTRTALFIGFLAALVVNLIGVNVGLWAGYYKGLLDDFLMRIVDIMYALPFEPFAMILVLLFDPSIWIVILAIGLLTWRTNARVIRSQVLSLSERPFVKAARVVGASNSRILYIHIAPNILPLAFLQLAVAMGYAITAEATLSFLGLGPPRLYSWGTILHAARLSGAWRTAWWWIIPPGLLIMITVVSVFFISRALEVITNPRLEGELENADNQ